MLIGTFVAQRLDGFSEAELDELERIINMPEAILADWLTGREPIPLDAESALLRAMREAALAGGCVPEAATRS